MAVVMWRVVCGLSCVRGCWLLLGAGRCELLVVICCVAFDVYCLVSVV